MNHYISCICTILLRFWHLIPGLPFHGFTEEVALLLFTLAKAESSEEIVVGAMQCLIALALDLKVTIKHMKLLKDLLLHLAYKPAGQCCSELLVYVALFDSIVCIRSRVLVVCCSKRI